MEGRAREEERETSTTHFWQLGYDFAELMIRDEFPQSQSLVGAVHQLLDALQGGFLVGLGLGCTVGERNTKSDEGKPQSRRHCSFK